MAKLHDTEACTEQVILVGIERESDDGFDIEAGMDELAELVSTASAIPVARLTQKRERPHPAHYLGKGKMEELRLMLQSFDATGIVCNDELSPAQLRNMEAMLETKIMDRTMVILDIFATRAISREGKIQVELAQLKYRLSRLIGLGASMSRLGGGIGTRGPGEKKLETDRRYIKDRIVDLQNELDDIRTHRALLRSKRNKEGQTLVSLVGYTNAGKSSLLNALTDADVYAKDQLFATLDTTTRQVTLPNGSNILLTDTVGFIQKLPHHLIQAFRATLEELSHADILLHVVDTSNPSRQEQMQVVYQTLDSLGCQDTPVITVFNKIDLSPTLPLPIDNRASIKIRTSTITEEGLADLLSQTEILLQSFKKPMRILLPYTEGALLHFIHGRSEILEQEHTAEGVMLQLYADAETKNRLAPFEI